MARDTIGKSLIATSCQHTDSSMKYGPAMLQLGGSLYRKNADRQSKRLSDKCLGNKNRGAGIGNRNAGCGVPPRMQSVYA
jgi:hypothetical protein